MVPHRSFPEAALPRPSLELVEELNHRVVNEYAEAIACLTAAARRSPSPFARKALTDAAHRLMAHADAHRALLPPPVEGMVSLADYVGSSARPFQRRRSSTVACGSRSRSRTSSSRRSAAGGSA